MKKILLSLFIASALVPALSFAQTPTGDGTYKLDYEGLVKCDGVVDETNPNEKARNRECDFQALMAMVNSIIKWVFGLSIPVFVFLFAYSGFLYMTPNPSNREKSNKMLWAALQGFAIMLIAWFIVTTLMGWVLRDSFKGTAGSLLEQKK